ncbi:MAG: Nicotinamide-nucleotide amidohydrolase PncC [uncultured Thiotrichaceae bacterium]|uniref:Nicotinamide-nucleotide amidohydrolase PncC n=1 Tax=uncultured Thiotrichaceae bacterium TaxID=298394 RepID=A0A6S6U9R2_9GAMM|nr:MAG: Nicotinamide-nucleotide amidohydrolase PncC [uncultured Thiotrichaceae bacterium]
MLKALADLLTKHDAMVVTAESCTGGLVAKLMTDIAGSSQWFDRGFVTYSNEAKHDMLGVSLELIEEHGAVSEVVVAEMTNGALENSQATYALAISGIAGPTGGSPEKPVGTVCFSFQERNQEPQLITQHFTGDRVQVRRAAAEFSIQKMLTLLKHSSMNI